jgi:hypothetical protein
MHLHLLATTAHLTIYYDSGNDWLFLDWQGELTLAAVQEACVEVGYCLLKRPYSRVLNSNVQVTNVSLSVAAWLVTELMPHLSLAGIDYMAWVGSSSLRGLSVAQLVIDWLSNGNIVLFYDLDEAFDWLQRRGSPSQTGQPLPQRLATTQAKLAQVVHGLAQKAAVQRPLRLPQ